MSSMKNSVSRATVAQYIREQAPKSVTIDEIVEKLYQNSPARDIRASTQAAVQRSIAMDSEPIKVLVEGKSWRYEPEATADSSYPEVYGSSRKRRISRPEILRYFQDRAGQVITRGELVHDLYGNSLAENVLAAVSTQIWVLIHKDKEPIEVVPGTWPHAWRYVGSVPVGPRILQPHVQSIAEPSKPKSSKRLFEEVGSTKKGSVIVEGEDGILYRLVEMD